MRYRLVVFDFDGTLADSLGPAVVLFNRLAPALAFKWIGRGVLGPVPIPVVLLVLAWFTIICWAVNIALSRGATAALRARILERYHVRYLVTNADTTPHGSWNGASIGMMSDPGLNC